MQGSGAVIRCALWCAVLLGCPAVALAAALHPAWDLDAAISSVPLVTGGGAALLLTEARWRRRQPRAAHARPAGLSLRQAMWSGIPIAGFMIAIAESDAVRLRALDYCGTVLLLTCVCGLPLRRWFARAAERPVDRKVYELAQNVAWTRQDVSRLHRLLSDLAGIAGVGVSDGTGDHVRRRHLRPVRTVRSDDTGPQKAVLGAPLAFIEVGEDHLHESNPA